MPRFGRPGRDREDRTLPGPAEQAVLPGAGGGPGAGTGTGGGPESRLMPVPGEGPGYAPDAGPVRAAGVLPGAGPGAGQEGPGRGPGGLMGGNLTSGLGAVRTGGLGSGQAGGLVAGRAGGPGGNLTSGLGGNLTSGLEAVRAGGPGSNLTSGLGGNLTSGLEAVRAGGLAAGRAGGLGDRLRAAFAAGAGAGIGAGLGAGTGGPWAGEPPIGKREISRAAELLVKYKQGKANLENRIVEDELWWQLRHWEVIRGKRPAPQRGPEPSSAWLFNAITNKHADAMDNFPEPIVLPREQSDEESARVLSCVLPVVLECNDYEQTYSDNWWEKLKHGTAAYGVFWDPQKENGLGDIAIRPIDLLKLFWEPGITDIQKSRNLFIAELEDTEVLEEQYPQFKGRLGGSTVDVKQYLYDDTVDTGDKSVVVDWYYKTRAPGGRTLLHYAKFVGDTLLFASENLPEYRQRGWYDHGLYPVVLDPLFPEKGTPVGFGYVAICKDPQLYIDKLSGNILENAMMASKKRFFASSSTAVNEQEFLDWNRPIVHVEGELDTRRLQEIVVRPLDQSTVNVLQMKIEEMKDTAANRDVNSGGAGSGVTAAAAIAALQEAGNKASRDMIAAAYRAHTKLAAMCVELIRQFYDETRAFRITGDAPGDYRFVGLNNAALKDQPLGLDAGGAPLFRRPVFDIKIRAQKKNPFSRMEQNERAKELYGMGFFDPERAQEALGALEMMDFEGKEKVVAYAQQGDTLLNLCRRMSAQMEQMAALLQAAAGESPGAGVAGDGETPAAGGSGQRAGQTGGTGQGGGQSGGITGQVLQARTPMTGYGQKLAERSKPSMP